MYVRYGRGPSAFLSLLASRSSQGHPRDVADRGEPCRAVASRAVSAVRCAVTVGNSLSSVRTKFVFRPRRSVPVVESTLSSRFPVIDPTCLPPHLLPRLWPASVLASLAVTRPIAARPSVRPAGRSTPANRAPGWLTDRPASWLADWSGGRAGRWRRRRRVAKTGPELSGDAVSHSARADVMSARPVRCDSI